MSDEIASKIITTVLGLGWGSLFVLVLLYPEKIEKWGVIFWKIIHFVVRKGEKKIVAHDIQGRVNEFAKELKKKCPYCEAVGIKIEWVTEKETQEEYLKENRLIVRMRKHEDQNKNFIYASMVFIAKAVLPKTKKYLSLSQKESIDLFVGRKLIEREKPQIADTFFEEYFSKKALTNRKIMELLERYEYIDKVGLFFPVLVQELSFLGEKIFYRPRNDKIISEVSEFVEFLKNYAEREVGEDQTPKNFKGPYCRCGIVIIAKSMKRAAGNVAPYVKYIGKLVSHKMENIYLVGSSDEENKKFIDEVSREIQEKYQYDKYSSREYKAKIKIKGERVEMNNYLVLHRSRDIMRYYDEEYQAKYFDDALADEITTW